MTTTHDRTSRTGDRLHHAEDGWILTRNGPLLGNRPLYADHRPFALLGGDRPVLRAVTADTPLGAVLVGARRGGGRPGGEHGDGELLWSHDAADITARYRAGRQEWTVSDPRLGGIRLRISAACAAGRTAALARLELLEAPEDVELVLAHGGVLDVHGTYRFDLSWHDQPVADVLWSADPSAHHDRATKTPTAEGANFTPEVPFLNDPDRALTAAACERNVLDLVSPTEAVLTHRDWPVGARLRLSVPGALEAVEARTLLRESEEREDAGPRPLLLAGLGTERDVIAEVAPSGTEESDADGEAGTALRRCWDLAVERTEALATRVTLECPDPEVVAAFPAVAAAMDGVHLGSTFLHGAMAWHLPLLGWRSMYGSTCWGWADRVTAAAEHYLPAQVPFPAPGEEAARAPVTIPDMRGALPQEDSRLYGPGRIAADQGFYNMQSVFFDQLIHAWRWSGDERLGQLLLPALEDHARWMQECFDPDGDRLYESYLDIWASDAIGYAGAATPYATAYAYAVHRAAASLGRQVGDEERARGHADRAASIAEAVLAGLWQDDVGAPVEWRDAEGTVHPEPTLASLAIPIDAGVVDGLRAAQAIVHSTASLERVPQALGGSVSWSSNFVPYVWSTRELGNADSLHLALAAYRTGLADQGWELLEGSLRTGMYGSRVPGAVLCEPPEIGTSMVDFSDPSSMLARTLVEGMAGWCPDLPGGRLTVRPQFPGHWDRAELVLPQGRLRFRRSGGVDRYEISTDLPVDRIELSVPVRSASSGSGGTAVGSGTAELGYGTPVRTVTGTDVRTLRVEVPYDEGFQDATIVALSQDAGRYVAGPGCRVLGWDDPSKALVDPRLQGGDLRFAVSDALTRPCSVRVLVGADLRADGSPDPDGGARWYRMLHVLPTPTPTPSPASDGEGAEGTEHDWSPLPLRELDADVREIFTHDHDSPRPQTVSVRTCRDGISVWTAPFGNVPPPRVAVEEGLLGGAVRADDGTQFRLGPGERNVVFVSTWDLWPREREIELGGVRADQLAILVVLASTPTRSAMDNGVLEVLYADGTGEEQPLHHPRTLWQICGDYDLDRDGFALSEGPPALVQLAPGTRACAVRIRTDRDREVVALRLRAVPQEVVLGVMAVSAGTLRPQPRDQEIFRHEEERAETPVP